MNDPAAAPAATMHVGPLGSAIHVLRARRRHRRRARRHRLDPAFRPGLARPRARPHRPDVPFVSPRRSRGDLWRHRRHRGGHAPADVKGAPLHPPSPARDPPGTGLEPDCAFYVGERAERFLAVLEENYAAAEAFIEHTGPDLVVEVEITSVVEAKIERYAELGVRELWRLKARRDSRAVEVDFLALRADGPPRVLAASEVLDGLTPADVCNAVEPVRCSRTFAERTRRWPASCGGAGRRRFGFARRTRRRTRPLRRAGGTYPPPTERGRVGLVPRAALARGEGPRAWAAGPYRRAMGGPPPRCNREAPAACLAGPSCAKFVRRIDGRLAERALVAATAKGASRRAGVAQGSAILWPWTSSPRRSTTTRSSSSIPGGRRFSSSTCSTSSARRAGPWSCPATRR